MGRAMGVQLYAGRVRLQLVCAPNPRNALENLKIIRGPNRLACTKDLPNPFETQCGSWVTDGKFEQIEHKPTGVFRYPPM